MRIWHLAAPLQPVIIGPDTTVIDGPLTDDGYVDYSAYLNQKHSAGVTTESNSVVLLMQALGPSEIPPLLRPTFFELLGVDPLPNDGPYLLDPEAFVRRRNLEPTEHHEQTLLLHDQLAAASRTPWTADEYPDVAALLVENERPLDLIIEASLRPDYYVPTLSDPATPPLLFTVQAFQQQQRKPVRLLTARAMLRLSEGDTERAWDDLLACHRLARLAGRDAAIIPALISVGIEAMACDSAKGLLASPHLSPEQARQCLADLRALPTTVDMAQIADETERFAFLDSIQTFARGQGDMFSDSNPNALPPARPNQATRFTVVDWNVVMRMGNEFYDSASDAMRIADVEHRSAQLERLNTDRVAVGGTHGLSLMTSRILGDRDSASREMGRILIALLAPSMTHARVAEDRNLANSSLAHIGFALAAWRREQGEYPESLDMLAPDLLAEVPLDPFTQKSFTYRRTDTGYRLYSVGDNGIDDNGVSYDDQPRGDDILLQIEGP